MITLSLDAFAPDYRLRGGFGYTVIHPDGGSSFVPDTSILGIQFEAPPLIREPESVAWFATAAAGSVYPQQIRAAYRGLLTACRELGIGVPRSDFITGPHATRPAGGEAFRFNAGGDLAGITFRENGQPRVGFVVGASPRNLFVTACHEARHCWQVYHAAELLGTDAGEEDAKRFEKDFRRRHEAMLLGFAA